MTTDIVKACCLRNTVDLERIPKDKPGYYKWWADRATVQVVLEKLGMDFDAIRTQLESKNDMYCIYVGVATKKSLRSRLDWHINQKHKFIAVRSGTLSTLRQTISALVGNSMADEKATNEFIDKLTVEYFLSNNPIKSEQAYDELHTIERRLLSSNYLYVLNIQDNKHALAPAKRLRELRKIAKTKALKSFDEE